MSENKQIHDVLIVGAGIVGTTLARRLSRYKLDVLVLESANDVAMGATKANSAIVHGGYAESHNLVKGRLCYQGRKQFAKLDEELNFGFDPIGSMVLSFDENDLPKLEELKENGNLNGLDDIEIIDRDKILELDPNVNPDVKYALYCKGAGVTSPYEMAIAMMENAIANGCELKLNTEVAHIKEVDGVFEVKDTSGNIYYSKLVVNCAGVNSAHVSHMVGIDKFKIIPRSGEYILFVRGTGSLVKHVLFQMPTDMGKGILVTPTYHGNLLLGPDAQDEEEIDRETHADRLVKIYQQALMTCDKINPQLFLRSFTGVRATSSTHDFIIEASEVEGFIQCAGIQSPGLTSSPAIADRVVNIIIENNLLTLEEDPNYNPYRAPIIKRKELKPLAEISHLVDMEEGDERMVCRCEQVTEGTIRDALSRGIPITSLDAVKRRTRAGMGWCQGAFCGPRVKEVLKRLAGIDVDDSTDVEHSGINRVQKSEFIDYLNSLENKN